MERKELGAGSQPSAAPHQLRTASNADAPLADRRKRAAELIEDIGWAYIDLASGNSSSSASNDIRERTKALMDFIFPTET